MDWTSGHGIKHTTNMYSSVGVGDVCLTSLNTLYSSCTRLIRTTKALLFLKSIEAGLGKFQLRLVCVWGTMTPALSFT